MVTGGGESSAITPWDWAAVAMRRRRRTTKPDQGQPPLFDAGRDGFSPASERRTGVLVLEELNHARPAARLPHQIARLRA